MSDTILNGTRVSGPAAGAAARRRALWWVTLLAVVVACGIGFAAATSSGGRALDPTSTDDDGSRALAHVLGHYGTTLTASSSLHEAEAREPDVIALLDPDQYSAAQLRGLVATGRSVVAIAPGEQAVRALTASTVETDPDGTAESNPGCALPAAIAAGPLDLPSDAMTYTDATTDTGAPTQNDGDRSCYGGLVVTAGSVTVLGSVDLLRNDHLAGSGVAALDVDLLSDGRTARSLVWLRAGADATGSGALGFWDLFPDSAYRGFVWLLVVGLLTLVWRARRMGPPVAEPLPVVVRSAELVEGHGRLYRRAGARDRAAQVLRAASLARLARAARLPADASDLQIGAAIAPLCGWSPADIHVALAGPVPSDDAALVQLARQLEALEAATERGGTR